MNRIFFSNPSLASDRVMDFLLLKGFSSFSCLFLPILLWSLYLLPPNSFHFMTGCCFCSLLGPNLKALLSRTSGDSPMRNIFYNDAENFVPCESFPCIKCLCEAQPPLGSILQQFLTPWESLHYFSSTTSYSFFCSFGSQMLPSILYGQHCATARAWQ